MTSENGLPPHAPRKTLSIIGCGNVGKALGRAWTRNGAFAIRQVLNRTPDSARRAAAFIGSGQAAASYAELEPADIYLIGTGDDQIAACGDALVRAGLVSPASIVFHCSGALRSDVLRSARERGAQVAAVHPIRSFADPAQVAQDFAGTYCGIEGDRRALKVLSEGFAAIGAKLVPIDAEHKAIYHAAAVFASNYLVTLLDVAVRAYAKAGVPQDVALELLGPLVRNTADNALRLGPRAALTGPIARGDMRTAIAQQQAIAAWDADCGELYKQLGELTADLAGQARPRFP
jgi:predicted short-subunit dehydrogenase-like oxidoreductase (DUF2520 family)